MCGFTCIAIAVNVTTAVAATVTTAMTAAVAAAVAAGVAAGSKRVATQKCECQRPRSCSDCSHQTIHALTDLPLRGAHTLTSACETVA